MASTLGEVFNPPPPLYAGLFPVFPGSERVRSTSCFKWLCYSIIFHSRSSSYSRFLKMHEIYLLEKKEPASMPSPESSDLCTHWKSCNWFLKSVSSHSSHRKSQHQSLRAYINHGHYKNKAPDDGCAQTQQMYQVNLLISSWFCGRLFFFVVVVVLPF